MIRLAGAYENKRSAKLLKRKEFIAEEFPIVSLHAGLGNWAGYVKRGVLRLPDDRTFGAGIRGNQPFLKAVLDEAEEYEGGTATLRFFGYTPDGVPRFPVIVDLVKGQRED